MTGLRAQLPPVVAGTAHLGSVLPWSTQASRAKELGQLDALFEAGCTAFDLAASYQLGGTEVLFGHWLRARRHRDSLQLISKGGHPFPWAQNRVTARALESDLHDSLRRLGTDRIDLYLVHRDHPSARLDEVLRTLQGFERAGKVRAWGVSNWHHSRVQELDLLAEKSGGSRVAASSPHHSVLHWRRPPWKGCVSLAGDLEAQAYYRDTQIPVLAWSPLGHGYFSKQPSAASRRVYDTPENRVRKQRAEHLAAEHGVSAAQIGLAYLFASGFPVSVSVGISSVAQLQSVQRATRIVLSREERESLR